MVFSTDRQASPTKKPKREPPTLPHAMQPSKRQAKQTQHSDKQAKNNRQGFALVSDTKKQRKNPALGRVSFSGFA